MKNQFRMSIKLDFWTIAIALALSFIGVLFIYSSTAAQGGTKYLKQLINLSVGLVAYMVISNVNYQKYSSKSMIVYLVGLSLLATTLFLGSSVNNSRSWIKLGAFSIQLSEFAKLFFVVAFSVFLNNYQANLKKFSFLVISFAVLVPFLILILLQPDMGTALTFLFVFFVMFYVGGGNGTYLGMIIGSGLVAVIVPVLAYFLVNKAEMKSFLVQMINSPQYLLMIGSGLSALGSGFYAICRYFRTSKKYLIHIAIVLMTIGLGFYGSIGTKVLLKTYHYERLLVFVDPDIDKEGKGYNVKQSKISIGSGGFSGQGLTKGKFNNGKHLPEEDTDFIIALVGEEWGFLGIATILLLYLFLIYRCLYVAYSARDLVGSLIALGISAMFVGHIMINIFSATGFFPVIGVPLPFISYGGSSLLTGFVGLGILFNIKMRRFSYN